METVLGWANSALAIVVVIGLCLFFHELGHFMAAKASKMLVHDFAMGFGPAIWKRKWGDTLYAVRIIPFGGFVRIAGMEPGENDVEGGFHSRPRWQGLTVLCAGTFMNLVLAVLLYWVIAVFSGIAVPDSTAVMVRNVFPGSVAEEVGVRPGDQLVGAAGGNRSTEILTVTPNSSGARIGLKKGARILQVGQKAVGTPAEVARELRAGVSKGTKIWILNPDATGINDAWIALEPPPAAAFAALPEVPEGRVGDEMAAKALGVHFAPMDQYAFQRTISSRPGVATSVTVLRGDQTLVFPVKPTADQARVELVDAQGRMSTPHEKVGRIGVVMGPEVRRAGVFEGLRMGFLQSVGAVRTVIFGFQAMFARRISAEPAGPVGIMAMSAETAKLGWASVLSLCALISANLAVVNMIPIPPFDGFMVVQVGVEAALRRRVNRRLELFVRLAGVMVILGLFLYLTYNDTMNLVKHGTY